MEAPPRVLIAEDDVSDLLLLRRLLRDTPYAVDTVRTASQALTALRKQEFAAVVTDDERLPDLAGAALLTEIGVDHPGQLRVLLARQERIPALVDGANAGHYRIIPRPFFAKPLVAALLEHAAHIMKRPDITDEIVVDAKAAELAPEPEGIGRIAYRRVLLTLAELVEAKGGIAAGHGARASALAGMLAREAKLTEPEIEWAEDAALVHDVGELALDAEILRRPGPLTPEEHDGLQLHVQSSYQIVRRAGLRAQVLAAVRHHHERMDGQGYPDGLTGPAIPVIARIVAIADTWDALATDRPYRRAAAPEDCVRELERLAGPQLDPELVKIYLEERIYELIDWSDPPKPGVKLL